MAEPSVADEPTAYALGVPIKCGDITFVSEEAKDEFMAWLEADSDEDVNP